jgi:hypothetical protein
LPYAGLAWIAIDRRPAPESPHISSMETASSE